MKESDYILTTNYARIKGAYNLITDTLPGFDGILTEKNRVVLARILQDLLDKYYKKFYKIMETE